MNTLKKLILIAAFLGAFQLHSQNSLLHGYLGCDNGFILYNTIQCADSGYLHFGQKIVRTDKNHSIKWGFQFNRAPLCQAAVELPNGDFVIVGSVSVGLTVDAFMCRIDSVGNLIWAKTLGDSIHYDSFYDVIALDDGGFMVAGLLCPQLISKTDVYIIRFDSMANIIWSRAVGEADFDGFPTIRKTPDNNFLVSGSTGNSSGNIIYFVKFDISGDTLFSKTYLNSKKTYIHDFIFTSTGQIAAIGTSKAFAPGGLLDLVLIITDTVGNPLVVKSFGDSLVEEGLAIIETNDGNLLLAGSMENYGYECSQSLDGDNCYNSLLIKTDMNGDTIWTRQHGDDYMQNIHTLFEESHSYFMTGYQIYMPPANLEVYAYTIQTDKNGYSSCFNHNNRVIVGNHSMPMGSGIGFSALNLQMSNIQLTSNFQYNFYYVNTCEQSNYVGDLTNTVELKLSPNPMSYSTVLSVEGGSLDGYNVSIYDANSRFVKTISVSNSKEIVIERDDMSPGVYFLRIKSTDKQVLKTVKLVVVP
ncbi:MAG: T9SS type A sorting domain-containing protein [Bacteroidales bacterium]|nr:T9SS type A sorting domain-containing protein [Bacteroidales bacterium]